MQEQGAIILCSTDIWTSLSQNSFLCRIILIKKIGQNHTFCMNHTFCTTKIEERHITENIAIALEIIFTDWDVTNWICTKVHDKDRKSVV